MPQRMKRLRVGIIGLGVGREHLQGYRRQRACEVSVLCDSSAEKLAQAGRQLSGVRLTRNDQDVLKDPTLDVVSIASYDSCHANEVLGALKAGKHVFVEKPLCRTLGELQKIKSAWEKKRGRLKLASNLVLRESPVYKRLKRMIDSGAMGTLYAFDGDYLYGRLEKITKGWRKDVRNYSVMAGGGIHLIDLFLWLTGERPRKVWAAGNRISTQKTSFRYNDYASATLECPSGLIGRITANFGCVHRHQHVVRVFGTRATFIHDDAGTRWFSSRDPRAKVSYWDTPGLPGSKAALIPAFIKSIRNRANIQNQTQSYFDGMSVSIAADASQRSHAPVEVCYV